ncbi:MAG: NADH-quinone oxidoreductase subunit J [Acidimicrobiales bacterium]
MTPLLAASAPDVTVFIICAVIVLSGAIGVITSRNAVHAALSLVMTLFGVAVLFIEQHAYFLAAVQVIVYAGAIVVLFLFVIMFLGVDRQEDIEIEPLKGQRPFALVFMAIGLGSILALAATANWVTGAHHVTGSLSAGHHTDTYLLGESIFTTYLWPFEITAALLVIAVVGAVVLARRPTRVHEAAGETGELGEPGEPGEPREPGPAGEPDGGTGLDEASIESSGARS